MVQDIQQQRQTLAKEKQDDKQLQELQAMFNDYQAKHKGVEPIDIKAHQIKTILIKTPNKIKDQQAP